MWIVGIEGGEEGALCCSQDGLGFCSRRGGLYDFVYACVGFSSDGLDLILTCHRLWTGKLFQHEEKDWRLHFRNGKPSVAAAIV